MTTLTRRASEETELSSSVRSFASNDPGDGQTPAKPHKRRDYELTRRARAPARNYVEPLGVACKEEVPDALVSSLLPRRPLDRLVSHARRTFRAAADRVTFDLAGRRTELTDPVNNTTSWTHDDADRVISESNALNFARTLVYNGADELTSVTDRNGRQRTFARDNLGRVTAEEWLDAAQTPIHTISYVHDAASQLTSVSDAYSSYAFGYNDAGWLTSEDNSPGAPGPGMPNVVLTHGYNPFGERTSRSDNLGGSTAFTFDLAHRMTAATLAVGTNTAQVA